MSWSYKPRDKGPSIEEPVQKRKKQHIGKKKFTIEYRRNPDIPKPKFPFFFNNIPVEWTVISKYATEKARDNAWDNLVKKAEDKNGLMRSYYIMQQFRKG